MTLRPAIVVTVETEADLRAMGAEYCRGAMRAVVMQHEGGGTRNPPGPFPCPDPRRAMLAASPPKAKITRAAR
jgi:hypothetical protein